MTAEQWVSSPVPVAPSASSVRCANLEEGKANISAAMGFSFSFVTDYIANTRKVSHRDEVEGYRSRIRVRMGCQASFGKWSPARVRDFSQSRVGRDSARLSRSPVAVSWSLSRGVAAAVPTSEVSEAHGDYRVA